MKLQHTQKHHSIHQLMHAISLLKNSDEALAFFTDLCTPAELEAMADRWEVVPLLRQGIPYRTIHDQTGVSVTTVTRVARCLSFGSGGYNLIAERLEQS
ncbi:YerC/YecD family TrpR-related protein [Legionella micdadei]|uniref:Putative Trp repressor n=1 Tax=Legionella micdadei TaxID=451 RepID=A0A098GFF7_LEGMI|nr:Trp operon repressor [Legionella micdadei]ARG97308.1 Trp operon repressor [Legionella micdadei]ARH00385.1 Trp operon repressor [Legionella micdadei]KTD28188.1 Trp repressor [Legionella micdadei]NSL16817.1 Trp operon repressor [Legionella micdadei]CEG61224.1 putative Trp repressor [Legionella micdadei]